MENSGTSIAIRPRKGRRRVCRREDRDQLALREGSQQEDLQHHIGIAAASLVNEAWQIMMWDNNETVGGFVRVFDTEFSR